MAERSRRVFGGRAPESEGNAEPTPEAPGDASEQTTNEQGNESEAAPETVATPGEAAPAAQAPEEVTNGYSGSGATLGLRLPQVRKVAKGESLQEKAHKAEQEKAAQEGAALLSLIAENSPEGEWVEFEVPDEPKAKQYRRLINSAAESHERNFTVNIGENPEAEVADGKPRPWLVQARTTKKTGAGRPKGSKNGQTAETPSEAAAEASA